MENLTMLTDLYQLTMMQSYFNLNTHNKKACFDVFFRDNGHNSFCICAGLEQVVEYITNIKFTLEDIDYLRSLNKFSKEFLEYLKDFKFNGNIRAVKEGSVVFPNEPILTVEASINEAQFIETAILNILNFETLIASKSAKIVFAADFCVIEMGARRAQGPSAAILGTRAAIIGGVDFTSNVYAGKKFGAMVTGTHSHSFVLSFKDELTAFREYAKNYPDNCVLLIDTFDTINSGLKNAIIVFKELREKGFEPKGIRIDSGDITYLSKIARKVLDSNGFFDVFICASGDLDENTILNLKKQGAKVDLWGVGTKLITSFDSPSLSGVYKLCAIEENGEVVPKMKISNDIGKMTNPAVKTVFRLYDKESKMALADVIALKNEKINTNALTLYKNNNLEDKITLANFITKEILVDIIKDGKLVYNLPKIQRIKEYAKQELATFSNDYKRIEVPKVYSVNLSGELYMLKKKFLEKKY